MTALAIFWRRTVLPVRGAATMSARCPLPSGAIMSMTRMERSLESVSRRMRSLGLVAVRLSKGTTPWDWSGLEWLISSTFRRAKYFSPSLGGRIWPLMMLPVRMPKRRICEGEM